MRRCRGSRATKWLTESKRISGRTDLGYAPWNWPRAASLLDSSGWLCRRSRRRSLRASRLAGDSRQNTGDAGLATKGAREIVRYAFEELGLAELVSLTAIRNERSRRVMAKLGMTHDATENFDHPGLPAGDPLRRHVLYRLTREKWLSQLHRSTFSRGNELR